MKLNIIEQGSMRLGFNESNGLPVLLENIQTGKQFLKNMHQPFFRLLMKSPKGSNVSYSGLDAATVGITMTPDGIIIHYNFIGMQALSVRCDITKNNNDGFDFAFKLRNVTENQLIELEYPLLYLCESLESHDADWILYNHGFRHGMLIHGFNNAFSPSDDQWHGSYIEPVQMIACGDSQQMLYFATRDTEYYYKHMKPTWIGDCLELYNRHFVDIKETGTFILPYPAELCILNKTGWQEAALKYRNWTLKQWWCEKRMDERDDVPKWWLSSPIVLSIKEQAKRNSDMMQRKSPWCHPLSNGIPRIIEVAKKLDSKLNVQVFHWERNGAFVNVDHFPPISGWTGTQDFFDQLHLNGHFGGLYILPLRWCIKAETSGYDGSEFFERNDALSALALNEDLEPVKSPWDWEWRKRFMMCGVAEPVHKEIVESFHKVSELGADYIQFDTYNGMMYDCWSKKHGHYPGRGRWQIDESIKLIKECMSTKNSYVMTFEAAPVPELMPFIHGFVERGLQARNENGREYIPLFQFLYHPYCQGFSGEECGAFTTIDRFFLVSAVSIINGDMLMINLDEEGKYAIMTHEPDEHTVTLENGYPVEQIESYIRRLNHLRRDLASEFLTSGTMEMDAVIECKDGMLSQDDKGCIIKTPAIIGRSWSSVSGCFGTVLINYTEKAQSARIQMSFRSDTLLNLYLDTDEILPLKSDSDGFIELTLPAFTSSVIK